MYSMHSKTMKRTGSLEKIRANKRKAPENEGIEADTQKQLEEQPIKIARLSRTLPLELCCEIFGCLNVPCQRRLIDLCKGINHVFDNKLRRNCSIWETQLNLFKHRCNLDSPDWDLAIFDSMERLKEEIIERIENINEMIKEANKGNYEEIRMRLELGSEKDWHMKRLAQTRIPSAMFHISHDFLHTKQLLHLLTGNESGHGFCGLPPIQLSPMSASIREHLIRLIHSRLDDGKETLERLRKINEEVLGVLNKLDAARKNLIQLLENLKREAGDPGCHLS